MTEIDLGIDGLSDYKEIGAGGFATVYSALETDVGRRVAVKVLTSIDEAGRRRFNRERLTMGQLTDHPNIVTLFRSGYTSPDNKPFLVMELLAGGSLQDRLETDGAVPWWEAIELILPVAQALGDSHSSGILHKDVKPANVLLSRTGVVKLSDFGIAAIRDATSISQMAFSLLYTAPETFAATQLADGEIVDIRDERSDLYSLAATLYALLTGGPPFRASSHAGLMREILTVAPAPVGHADLDRFFATALAKDPEQRFPTASHFSAKLRAFRPQGPMPPDSATEPAPQQTSPPVPRSDQVEDGSATRKPAPPQPHTDGAPGRWVAVGVASAIIAAAVGSWFLVGGAGDGPGDATTTLSDSASGTALVETDDSAAPPEPREPIVRASQDGSVEDVAVLPDGRIVSAGSSGIIHVWSPADPDRTLATYRGHDERIGGLAALPDGRIVSTALIGGAVHVWDPDDVDAAPVLYSGHDSSVPSVAVLTDGRVATSGSDDSVHLWNPDDPTDNTIIQLPNRFSLFALIAPLAETADGRIAIGSTNGTVHLLDPGLPSTITTVDTGHTGIVTSLSHFETDGWRRPTPTAPSTFGIPAIRRERWSCTAATTSRSMPCCRSRTAGSLRQRPTTPCSSGILQIPMSPCPPMTPTGRPCPTSSS